MEKRFITHLVTETGSGIPVTGFKKLFFYTRKSSSPGKWYFGKGNNSFSEEEMKGKILRRTIIFLPEEVELEPGKGLWFNKEGKVFYGDLVRRADLGFNKHFLFNSPELLELCK